MAAKFLTDSDVAILKRMIADVKQLRVNAPVQDQEESIHQAPEVYVAKPQSAEGIPALSPDDPDVPGKDDCDFYRINDDDELTQITGLEREVFNLTSSTIPQDWFTAVRTKGGAWVAQKSGLSLRHFEMQEAITPGQTKTAFLIDDGVLDTDTTFEVEDLLGIFRGRAKDAFSSPHNQGSRGIAVAWPGATNWSILEFQPHALMIHGQLTADIVAGGNFTIESAVVFSPVGSIITNTDPAANISIINLFGFDGDDEGECVAVWDENGVRWVALQVECIV